jgi:hypothetical protein
MAWTSERLAKISLSSSKQIFSGIWSQQWRANTVSDLCEQALQREISVHVAHK